MTRKLIPLALMAVVGSVSAEGFMPWTKVADMADLNDDGMLTMFEVERFKPVAKFPGFQPWMADHFADLDTDNDGMVDSEELASAKERTTTCQAKDGVLRSLIPVAPRIKHCETQAPNAK